MEVQDIARAIIGPWFPVPEDSPYSLRELREARWDMATRAERGEALNAALAVHREIAEVVVANGALVAALKDIVDGYGPNHGSQYCANLARAALARCSSQVKQPQ